MASSFNSIGKTVAGKPAMVDYRIVAPLLAAHRLIKKLYGYDMGERIIQAKGGSGLSAGTHLDGFAVDYRTRGMSKAIIIAIVLIFRMCGFSATWYRDWAGNEHIHAGANMGGLNTRVRYQVLAVIAGFDGTGYRGRKNKDTDPRPDKWRDVYSGLEWANSKLHPQTNKGLTVADINDIIKRLEYVEAQNKSNAESIAYVSAQAKALGDMIQLVLNKLAE